MGFPVFKGGTRTPTYLGVPSKVFIGIVVGSVAIMMPINPPYMVIGIPLIIIARTISKNDDKAFRIMWLYIITTLKRIALRGKQSFYSPNDWGQ